MSLQKEVDYFAFVIRAFTSKHFSKMKSCCFYVGANTANDWDENADDASQFGTTVWAICQSGFLLALPI